MLSKKIFINKKILIYGFGISGKSCFKYLNKNNLVTVFDDDKYVITNINKKFFQKISTIHNKEFDFIVLSPGIDIKRCKLKKFLIKNKTKIITELDIF